MPSKNAQTGKYDNFVAGDPLTAEEINNNERLSVSVSGTQTINGDKSFGGNDNFSNPITFPAQLKVFTAGEAITGGQPVCIGPYQSDGGILFDNKSALSANVTAGATTGTQNFTFTINHGGGNNVLIVSILNLIDVNHPTGCPSMITGVTWNGVAMTQSMAKTNIGNSSGYAQIFSLANAAQGTYTLAVSWSTTSGTGYTSGIYLHAYNYYQTAGIDDTQSLQEGGYPNGTTVTAGGQNPAELIFSSGFNVGGFGSAVANNNNNNQLNSSVMYSGDGGINAFQVPASVKYASHGNDGYQQAVCCIALRPATAPDFSYVYKAGSANATPNACNFTRYKQFVGIANATVSAGQAISVFISGIASNFSGLYGGLQYYLNDTAGTIGTSAGTNSRKIGIAMSATTLLITNIW